MQRVLVHSISLGCPKNRVDTERLLACFGQAYEPCDTPEQADVVLVNTCGFIAPAVEESVDVILDMAQAVEGLTPRPLLAVVGCLVGRYGSQLEEEIPEVDLWLPTRELCRWPERIAGALGRPFPAPGESERVLSTGPSYAYIKVAEGCDHRCSFCTIPSIRGPLASRPVDAIRAEAEALLARGVRELVLVAQDLTAWGRDIGEKRGLAAVLEALLPLPGLARLRPMYLYPGGLTPELLAFMREAGPPLVPYFDVPLQHAHPAILRSMGRPFAEDPRPVVERIRSYFPGAALRTSIIVGYPGETEEHFAALRDFVAETRFHHLGVFAYCDEEGTRAFGLPDKVPAETAARRRDEIMALQAEISADIMAEYAHTEQQVLVDAEHGEWPGLHVGRCWFQAPEVDGVTYVSGEGVRPGALVTALIHEAQTYDLVALA